MVINRQTELSIDLRSTRDLVKRLRKYLRLGRRDFNVCFVHDLEIARLNATYRGKAGPTDVLSFPWQSARKGARNSVPAAVSHEHRAEARLSRKRTAGGTQSSPPPELANFLGDIVISAETARRNARAARHSTAREIRWLILHGVLHLIGYDHETDNGNMKALELSMRTRLNV